MKVLDQRNLPEERLATMDETGKRVYIFPAQVKGLFRRYRAIVQAVLVLFFLILPWVKIGGHQAVLLDIAERKFAIFGLTFWAHDGPLVFFLLAALGIGLAFITAVWGRIWCGWACPQTVFIDGVFRQIEYRIIGSHVKQMNLAKAPWNGEKLIKYSVVWILFTVVSLIIAHSFLAYFVGAEELVGMTQHNPYQNWTAFLVMAFVAGVLLFDFGWFREQFCIIMCPYGRFQSVLLDDDSITVSYDPNRGEPRRGSVKLGEDEGDCINCYKCVAVCPTGIDIRRGLQMECIGCTACIDACDEVMEKVGKPKGLIRYTTGNSLKGIKSRILRPRVAIYSILLAVVLSLLAINVSNREDIVITILRGKDMPYQVIESEESDEEDEEEIDDETNNVQVINHFKVHMKNQSFDDVKLKMAVPEMWKEKDVEVISPTDTFNLEAGKDLTVHFFVKFPGEITGGTGKESIELTFTDLGENLIKLEKELYLVGPKSF
ncbi:MAG TPA: cytochrome c oxidase accessory protein CcoG [Thermodesulfobacteriota bacterium]|nr:cytochrome c oxidase accessory protein CcoG [Thermodesulfobacteriota bacterium]